MPLNKSLFAVAGKLIFCSLILLCLATTWSKAELIVQSGEPVTKVSWLQVEEGTFIPIPCWSKKFDLPGESGISVLEHNNADKVIWIRSRTERTRSLDPIHLLWEGPNAVQTFRSTNTASYLGASTYANENGLLGFTDEDEVVLVDLPGYKEPKQSFKAVLERIVLSTDSVIYPLAGTSLGLPFKNNSLRFYVAAPGYNEADENRFQFWLEGYEEDWSTWKKEPFKEYTQIPEGTYTLHIKGINSQSGISKEGLYTFSISPPWYRTGVMYFIYLIVAGAAIYALIRWRHSELEAEKAYLEQVVYRFNREVAAKNEELEKLTEELATQNEKLQELDRLKSRAFEQTP